MMKQQMRYTLLSVYLAFFMCMQSALAQDSDSTHLDVTHHSMDKETAERFYKKPGYSPWAGRNFATRPLWGDQHVHTSVSFDAVAFGNRLGPEAAYRFARGEEVVSSTGVAAKLSRPLDWIVIADHAETMGAMGDVLDGNPMLMNDPDVRRWNNMLKQGGEEAMKVYYEMVRRAGSSDNPLPDVITNKKFIRSVWERQTAAAEKYNEPGKFTAFHGYEWSSTQNGNNLHRVVVYRGDKEQADQMLPLPADKVFHPESLWEWMATYEEKTGGSVLAIPHNGNLSNGRMFPLVNPYDGKPITKEYAEARARWEPLYEVTQQKGDGEAHPFLSPDDEFADFENWDFGNLGGAEQKTDSMFEFEYARPALKNGLKVEDDLGANPFKFGLLGGSDTHTSLVIDTEDNYFGKLPEVEPSARRADETFVDFGKGRPKIKGWQLLASGYAAVWARENTREAIWDAMARREVYATTGERMVVRFFGGWDYQETDTHTRNPAVVGYSKGVPMGGDLYKAPKGKSPTFLVAAMKDPFGANLDRIQIVKGWLNDKGNTQEKVYDVVWGDADKRQPNKNGKVPPVGNTVDVANATWTNTIGDSELIGVWEDPDFDPDLKAFYYVRVITIPTPRWTAYDAKHFNVKMPKEVPMVATERAYTSPIWYNPVRL